MAQPSVANYFNSKKRPVVEDVKTNNARKVLILDEDKPEHAVSTDLESPISCQDIKNKIKTVQNIITPKKTTRKIITLKSNKAKCTINQGNIRLFLSGADESKKNLLASDASGSLENKSETECTSDISNNVIESSIGSAADNLKPLAQVDSRLSQLPTTTPNKLNIVRDSGVKGAELTLSQIKQKLNRSSRLAELKASLSRFQEFEEKLESAKQKTLQTKDALSLKNFKTLELEINLSPQKLKSPEKPYLSPKKDLQGSRKNLFGLQSPVKKDTSCSEVKHSLTLPYKYRFLAEVFRSIDTVSQILHNRKETITFNKLKPAVEEMLKRNLTEKHLAQITYLYPDSYFLRREKLRQFGIGSQGERWELVIEPQLKQGEQMTPDIVLERRRKLFNILIEKLKDYHQEFLATLDPPMEIDRTKITRWHPSFDLEKVPDIEMLDLPPQPMEEKFTTGHEVLQRAREMFSCNTRMERALEHLKTSSQNTNIPETSSEETSILKGIPKALLEKVRQKQAAKAFESMTRSATKDKEVQLYLKLPEIARLTRNLFVAEKKSVLPLDLVIDKLCNSYREFVNKNDMENFLRTISKEINDWLFFYEIRGEFFLKISKNSDLNVIMNKLQQLAELKDS